MGIIGEYAGEARATIMPILAVVFVVGMLAFFYSKWIEQGGIRQGAELVRKMIDVDINPRYEGSPFRIRWTVSVVAAAVARGGGGVVAAAVVVTVCAAGVSHPRRRACSRSRPPCIAHPLARLLVLPTAPHYPRRAGQRAPQGQEGLPPGQGDV
jgi:hypothetical protein